jgi:hypothetical protein
MRHPTIKGKAYERQFARQGGDFGPVEQVTTARYDRSPLEVLFLLVGEF